MATNILMPALSPTMTEGTLSRWLKKEGENVRAGDVIAEIETDKATMEVEADEDGTLSQVLVPEATEGVKVGEVIALIAPAGEAAPASQRLEPARQQVPEPPVGSPDIVDTVNAGIRWWRCGQAASFW